MSGADPQTIAALAALHARCFTDAPPPWSAAAFATALDAPGTVLLAPAPDRAFLLGRVIAVREVPAGIMMVIVGVPFFLLAIRRSRFVQAS